MIIFGLSFGLFIRRIFFVFLFCLFLVSCSNTGYNISESYGLTLNHSLSEFYKIPARDRRLALKGAMYTRIQRNKSYVPSGKLEQIIPYYLGCIEGFENRKFYDPNMRLDAAIEICAKQFG